MVQIPSENCQFSEEREKLFYVGPDKSRNQVLCSCGTTATAKKKILEISFSYSVYPISFRLEYSKP